MFLVQSPIRSVAEKPIMQERCPGSRWQLFHEKGSDSCCLPTILFSAQVLVVHNTKFYANMWNHVAVVRTLLWKLFFSCLTHENWVSIVEACRSFWGRTGWLNEIRWRNDDLSSSFYAGIDFLPISRWREVVRELLQVSVLCKHDPIATQTK